MKRSTITITLAAALCAAGISSKAQTTLTHSWMTRIDGSSQRTDMVRDMYTDRWGNSILTGNSNDSTAGSTLTPLVLTTRIATDGSVKWKDKRFAQNGFQLFAGKTVKAKDGNVLIAFNERKDDAMQNRILLRKVKHTDGSLIWERTLTDTTNNIVEEISDLITDTAGNIYICAGTTNFSAPSFNTDYVVMKVMENGDTAWRRTYNNAAYNSDDYAADLAIDRDLNVLVTGRSRGIIGGVPTGFDITTVKYSSAGAELWVHRHNGTGYGNDIGMMIITDNDNNAYISGQTDALSLSTDSVTVIKLAPTGTVVWQYNYLGSNTGTLFKQPISLTPSGNIALACGTSEGMTTILLNNMGVRLWKKSFMRDNQIAMPFHMITDTAGNIIVTGRTHLSAPTLDDVTTLGYDESGALIWNAFFNGTSSGSMDFGRHVGIDGGNNIYIGAWSTFDDNNNDFTLLKYGTNPVPVDTTPTLYTPITSRSHSVHLYPNPTDNMLHVVSQGSAFTSFRITNVAGRVYIAETLTPGNQQFEVSVADLAPGLYILEATEETGLRTSTRFIRKQ
ncbi:MAG: T9SS type A sorting domain-containing protein [Flavipsychrobacter sp.]|nr:T9SS type A sorting domain-containing protein [Flavipsychrobacter sp.]